MSMTGFELARRVAKAKLEEEKKAEELKKAEKKAKPVEEPARPKLSIKTVE